MSVLLFYFHCYLLHYFYTIFFFIIYKPVPLKRKYSYKILYVYTQTPNYLTFNPFPNTPNQFPAKKKPHHSLSLTHFFFFYFVNVTYQLLNSPSLPSSINPLLAFYSLDINFSLPTSLSIRLYSSLIPDSLPLRWILLLFQESYYQFFLLPVGLLSPKSPAFNYSHHFILRSLKPTVFSTDLCKYLQFRFLQFCLLYQVPSSPLFA